MKKKTIEIISFLFLKNRSNKMGFGKKMLQYLWKDISAIFILFRMKYYVAKCFTMLHTIRIKVI